MLLVCGVAAAQNREVVSLPSAKAASEADVAALRERVEVLEAELKLIKPGQSSSSNDDLTRRIEALERSLSGTRAKSVIPTGKVQWREIRRGMRAGQIRLLLGEPTSIRSDSIWEHWSYPNGGNVQIDHRTGVDGWREPSR